MCKHRRDRSHVCPCASAAGTPPKEVCKNFTRPETFAQPDVDLKHDFTNGVFERAQSMSPGAPPTVNEITFVGNQSANEVERIFDPEVCQPIDGKAYCVVCQPANYSGVPDRVAVPTQVNIYRLMSLCVPLCPALSLSVLSLCNV